jgi:hypothetical protein
MEFAKDLLSSLRGRVSAPPQGMPGGRIDWSELHARLGAAHAAARELALVGRHNPAIAGGFTEWSADRTAGGKSSTSVNRTDLADGKAAEGIDSAIAGKTITGGQEQ